MSQCTRCHSPLPTELPQEGHRYGLRMKTKTVEHTLRFSIIRFRWMPKDPADLVRTTYTDFPLCDPCASAVMDFAHRREPEDVQRERRIAELERELDITGGER